MFKLAISVQTVTHDNIFAFAEKHKLIVLSCLLVLLGCVVISMIAYMLFRMYQFRVKKKVWREYEAHYDLLEQIDTAVMILPVDNMNDLTSASAYSYLNTAGQLFLKTLTSSEAGELDYKSIKRFRADLHHIKQHGQAEDLRVGVFKNGTNYTLYFSGKKVSVLGHDSLLITLIPLNEYRPVIRRQLHAANESLDFLQSISQHIAQPLDALLKRINTLLHTKNLVHREGIIRALKVQNDELQHTVNSIIDYSMLEYGQANMKCYYHDVLTHVQTGVTAMENLAKQYPEVDLIISQPYSKLELDIDDICIPACWTIFIENAILHVGKGKIEAGLCYENGELIAYCLDAGDEIPQHLQLALFEKFATYGDGEHQSVGMGLAINKAIARVFKGLIGVVSLPESGSLFWIQIPVKGQAELCADADLTRTDSLLQQRKQGVWFDATSGRDMVVRGAQKGGRK